MKTIVALIVGALLGCMASNVVNVALADKPEPRATVISKVDRLVITNPAGDVKITIHSDPKPTIEVVDLKGKVEKGDLVQLLRLANR